MSGAGAPHNSSHLQSGAIACAIARSRSPQSARPRSARKRPDFGRGSRVQASALPIQQFSVDDWVLREAKATANVAHLRDFLCQQEASKRADGAAPGDTAEQQLQLFNKVAHSPSGLALARRVSSRATTGLKYVQYADNSARYAA